MWFKLVIQHIVYYDRGDKDDEQIHITFSEFDGNEITPIRFRVDYRSYDRFFPYHINLIAEHETYIVRRVLQSKGLILKPDVSQLIRAYQAEGWRLTDQTDQNVSPGVGFRNHEMVYIFTRDNPIAQASLPHTLTSRMTKKVDNR